MTHTKIMTSTIVKDYVNLDGKSLINVIKEVQDWVVVHGEAAYLSSEQEPYDDVYRYVVRVAREETDDEFAARTERIMRQEKYERANYERLKAIYDTP